MLQYTHVYQWGNQLLVRGVDRRTEQRFEERIKFKPTLYRKTDRESGIRSLFGVPLESMDFDGIRDAKDYYKSYSETAGGPKIYGNPNFVTQFMHNLSSEYDSKLLNVIFIDIETTVTPGQGVPDPAIAPNEVLLVSAYNRRTGKGKVFATKPFGGTLPDGWVYQQCDTEYDLLQSFLSYLLTNQADILTGWNTDYFDVPYLHSRMVRVLGDTVKNLSPWGVVYEGKTFENDREQKTVTIAGVSQLDLMALYKKYTQGSRESYSLAFISDYEELNVQKQDHSDIPGFVEFYTDHWDRFVSYNVDDVRATVELDKKLNLVNLHVSIAYMAKENFEDAFSPVRTWENVLYHTLHARGVEFDPVDDAQSRVYPGGYVHDPKPGLYGWICTLDATSLYPSLIMTYNISPETFVRKESESTFDRVIESRQFVSDYPDLCMAANGAIFTKDKRGIIPEVTETLFDRRKKTKAKMLELDKEYQQTKDPKLGDQVRILDTEQNAIKVLLNSLYGALANKYFRYYDVNLAEAITLSGQTIVKSIINTIPNTLKDHNVSVIYSDTDSVFFDVSTPASQCQDKTNRVQHVETVAKTIIQPAVALIVNNMLSLSGCYENKISFKLEGIGDKFLIVGKKHYVIRLLYKEGVFYDKPKPKIMGLELIKSTTPKAMRDVLKKGLDIILSGDQSKLWKFVTMAQKWYIEQPIATIAFSKGVNNMSKYADSRTIYQKGCPIHVRAALLYNNYTDKKGYDRSKYPLIVSGDKIKYVYLVTPNIIKENVVAFLQECPEELAKFFDYDTMWEKSFVSNLDSLANTAGLSLTPKSTLDDFFG